MLGFLHFLSTPPQSTPAILSVGFFVCIWAHHQRLEINWLYVLPTLRASSWTSWGTVHVIWGAGSMLSLMVRPSCCCSTKTPFSIKSGWFAAAISSGNEEWYQCSGVGTWGWRGYLRFIGSRLQCYRIRNGMIVEAVTASGIPRTPWILALRIVADRVVHERSSVHAAQLKNSQLKSLSRNRCTRKWRQGV